MEGIMQFTNVNDLLPALRQLVREELQGISTKGAPETMMCTADIMAHFGIKSHETFRAAVKKYRAKPVSTIGGRKWYYPSQFQTAIK